MLRYEDYRQHVEQLMGAALSAADPAKAMRRFLHRNGHILHIGDLTYDLERGRAYVVSVGKAAAPMAEATIGVLGDGLHSALVICKKGGQGAEGGEWRGVSGVTVMEGNHPVPGEESVQAARAAMDMLAETGVDDLVLCLISGGTSALLTLPVIPLSDWQKLTSSLLASGCTIDELNSVRRQLDRVKGGGLAQMAVPAQCISLILSDVVGNPLEAIGSGPTLFIDESREDASVVLDRFSIESRLEHDVWQRIGQALERHNENTSRNRRKSADQLNDHIVVGDVRQAATMALSKAMQIGFVAQLLTARLEGEAREVGRVAAAVAKDLPEGRCYILGGETTVTLKGDGLGGRNQEVALAAAVALDGWSDTVIASFATDGEDGPTPAAGAVVSCETAQNGRVIGLDPLAFLDRNDSYHFFHGLDESISGVASGEGRVTVGDKSIPRSLLITGPTGTNVNDLIFLLTYPRGS